jgi:hypothetical protein
MLIEINETEYSYHWSGVAVEKKAFFLTTPPKNSSIQFLFGSIGIND